MMLLRFAFFMTAVIAISLLLAIYVGSYPTGIVSYVIDGDTFEVGRKRIRLWGMDAPEEDQICIDGTGNTYPCGIAARKRLENLIGGKHVSCTTMDTDKYGRTIATCFTGNQDVGLTLVQNGLAVINRRYPSNYIQFEDEARLAKRGLWSGFFENPWEHRRAKH